MKITKFDVAQLTAWTLGKSQHSQYDSCCPDFSCCAEPKEEADIRIKQRFLKAFIEGDHRTMIMIVQMFCQGYCSDEILYSELDHRTIQ